MAGDLPAGWSSQCLYDLAEYINGRATKPSELDPSGVHVIKIAELNGGISEGTDRVPAAIVQNRHWVTDGDLLFAWSGSVGIYTYRGPRAALNQHIFNVVARRGVDQRFLRYLLQGQLNVFQRFVENKKTTMGHVTVRDLRATHVAVPPHSEQLVIASILGTLDDKIDLNQRMGETSEAIALSLFRSWFIDFAPVRAKVEGRETGFPAPLADLFPARLVQSEVGEIPEGWEIKSLDEIARFLNGLALQKYPAKDSASLPIIKIAQLRSGTVRGADRASTNVPSEYIVKDGDILFSWSGSLECVLWAGGEGALNQHLFKVTSDRYPRWLCYLGVRAHLNDFREIAAGKATTMGHIQRHHLTAAKLAIPPRSVISAMDGVLRPLVESIWVHSVQSRYLAEIREFLLPKLIFGEIRTMSGAP